MSILSLSTLVIIRYPIFYTFESSLSVRVQSQIDTWKVWYFFLLGRFLLQLLTVNEMWNIHYFSAAFLIRHPSAKCLCSAKCFGQALNQVDQDLPGHNSIRRHKSIYTRYIIIQSLKYDNLLGHASQWLAQDNFLGWSKYKQIKHCVLFILVLVD